MVQFRPIWPLQRGFPCPRYSARPMGTYFRLSARLSSNKSTSSTGDSNPSTDAPDHRVLGVQQSLFTTSPYSPGSPLFLPNGTTIFNRLIEFLRKQYIYYGFQEVITPTIYKRALWEKSGHWENYADDMYAVTSRLHQHQQHPGSIAATAIPASTNAHGSGCNHDHGTADVDAEVDIDDFGLKPMNCPGHCLLFASQARSYRDLPIRFADFSPLHRNEISGALSGLTRVRRFHQDDGHIFCRPAQVEAEIGRTLEMVRVVYGVLQLGVGYRLALSTRPEKFIGEVDEWSRAEAALSRALDASGLPWTTNDGDGAFYGPKIDIILQDSDGKEHQTATIQLDFQLPKRFGLEYQAPAPELEARGETTDDPQLLASYGPVAPVMVHRAVLGSVERLMALLIEKTGGTWPFWLNPQQAVIVTVNDTPEILAYAQKVHDLLEGHDEQARQALAHGEARGVSASPLAAFRQPTGLSVEIDTRTESVGRKASQAREKGYGLVIVVGKQEVRDGLVTVSGRSLPVGADGQSRKKASMTPEELLHMMQEMAATFQ
ncbi:Threonine--tRNA ligase, cytoplasmic [Ceratocystis lukuohia]|uniref:threonine--tRNA ligase n=1 Tax=Ceratocystis lukuohia TaxID=2019550 RepID=A0ABR4MSU3_9PEZI